jgi:hypothetical protein
MATPPGVGIRSPWARAHGLVTPKRAHEKPTKNPSKAHKSPGSTPKVTPECS